MTKREQIVSSRLLALREEVRSGSTEMTGKTYRDSSGAIAGRFRGGFSVLYPEVSSSGLTPGQAAAAVERGKGKRFERLAKASMKEVERAYGPEPRRRIQKPTVSPHTGNRKCSHCGVLHSKGQHRFHGPGSFHSTHMFAFNMRKQKCGFCASTAVCTIKKYRLCRSCLSKLCRLKGIAVPRLGAAKRNPPAKRIGVVGSPGKYWLAVTQGRKIERLIAGPFKTFDSAVEANLLREIRGRKPKANPGPSNDDLSVFKKFLESRGYLPAALRADIVRGLFEQKELRREFYQWIKGRGLLDTPTLFNPRRRTKCNPRRPRGWKFETVRLRASNGRPVRQVTRVTTPKGKTITFTEKLSKREAVRQLEAMKENPRNAVRLGTALEIRYKRDIGKYPGFYKHAFDSEPELFYRPKQNEVVVR